MEDNTINNEAVEQSKQEIKEDAKGLLVSLKKFLIELLDFREDTDHKATIEAIKADIPFKGATAWILIFAVFVASIGLNADSTAVVIGAMLISPLMGPILGIGSAFAINDINIFKKSIISLATMIILSLLASFIFFYFFPLSEDTSELLGRTKPDIRDVLIAFFGGLALMVARTKKGTVASVIFGVAIATALMPPLCTAGYGLAVGNLEFFIGAMYLFTINTTFIALSTFIVLKLLRFPMHKYANAAKRKRYSTIATIVGIAVMIPAIWTFINVLEKSGLERDYKKFIEIEVSSNEDLWLQRNKLFIDEKKISLFFNGEITNATISDLQNELKSYNNIKDFTLDINGNKTRSSDKISESLDRAYLNIDKKENIISGLHKEIKGLEETINQLNTRIEIDASNKNKNIIAFSRISKDAKIRYQDMQQIGFANVLSSKDFIKIDTIPQIIIKWNNSLPDSIIRPKEIELRTWLQKEMKLDTLFIKRE